MKKIILIIFLFVFTGCYNYQEVNNLAIVSSFSIDYIDDDYVIILEVQENNKDNKYASYLLKGKGKSLESALQNSSIPFNKELYFMNLNVLMLTTEVASLRLDNIINFIIRDNNFSFDYNVAICDNPEDAFEIITKEEEIFGKYAKKLFNKTTNNNLNIKINDLLQSHLNKYKDIILPVFEVKDDFLVLENAAIYDEDEIIDYLTQEEIAIYNVLINAPINFHLNKESFLFKTKDRKSVV